VPIRENGEPLVDFRGLSDRLVFSWGVFNYTRATLLRKTVAERLAEAAEKLPDGLMLGVIEGWRPLYIQKRMYLSAMQRMKERHPEWSEVKLKRRVNVLSAPIDPRVPPPHSTGGAVDLRLLLPDGTAADLTSPFEQMDPKCYPFEIHGLSPQAKRNRSLMKEVLESVEITNYPSEFWHWSYGDQGWAYRGHHPFAFYNSVEPEGWIAVEEDAVEEPLHFLHEMEDG
jgi:D-alanyl-D-alanine dipeptidase